MVIPGVNAEAYHQQLLLHRHHNPAEMHRVDWWGFFEQKLHDSEFIYSNLAFAYLYARILWVAAAIFLLVFNWVSIILTCKKELKYSVVHIIQILLNPTKIWISRKFKYLCGDLKKIRKFELSGHNTLI